MKYSPFYFSIFILLFFFGCDGNVVSPTSSNSSKSGQMVMKINSGTVPSDVVKITFVLTQSGKDALTQTAEPTTDSTASISFTDVPVGTWHLTVSAEDSTGEILYTGSSDVLVQGGVTTQVNINLQSYSSVTGIVDITVSWGNSLNNWNAYSGNPVLTINENLSSPDHVCQSKVLYDNGIYKMWYMCIYSAGKGNIWYAESEDGKNWVNVSYVPNFDSGDSSAWDGYTVSPGAIIKIGSLYYLYYNGWKSQSGKWQIGLATSTDGIHWERRSEPVLSANDSNEYKIGAQSIVYYNGSYYLYYTSSPYNSYFSQRINLAISSDGVNFTKYQGNPILSPTYVWEGIGITYPTVIYENNQFFMIYQNTDNTKFGAAKSSDGIHWEKLSSYVFSASNTNNYYEIDYPNLIKAGNEYKLYFSGRLTSLQNMPNSPFSIGLATSNKLF